MCSDGNDLFCCADHLVTWCLSVTLHSNTVRMRSTDAVYKAKLSLVVRMSGWGCLDGLYTFPVCWFCIHVSLFQTVDEVFPVCYTHICYD